MSIQATIRPLSRSLNFDFRPMLKTKLLLLSNEWLLLGGEEFAITTSGHTDSKFNNSEQPSNKPFNVYKIIITIVTYWKNPRGEIPSTENQVKMLHANHR